ncbi:MAG TPA: replication protein P [Thiohalobacter sp.]|nr:replication protein P [Thiohalobacter sp.]
MSGSEAKHTGSIPTLKQALAVCWGEMVVLYGSRWTREYGDLNEGPFLRWLDLLETQGIDAAGVARAVRYIQVERSKTPQGKFLPTFSDFAAAAAPQPEDFGLPTARAAYEEALRALGRWQEYAWSHEAVRIAATDIGSWAFSRSTEREVFPRFSAAYQALVKRVMAGEPLPVPKTRRIPPAEAQSQSQAPMSRAEAISAMAKMLPGMKARSDK